MGAAVEIKKATSKSPEPFVLNPMLLAFYDLSIEEIVLLNRFAASRRRIGFDQDWAGILQNSRKASLQRPR